MAKSNKKTTSELEKEKRVEDLRQRVQAQADKKKICMGDFQKNWNAKNKEKITEMVKLGNTVLIRFGNCTVHCFTENLYM